MKKLLFITILLMSTIWSNAQTVGLNGAGFFENYTAQAEQWLLELDKSFTLRVPGGSIAKFADPYTNPNGWGMTHEGIDSIFALYGSTDETGNEDKSKWYTKADQQPNYSYLDALIDFCALFPDTKVIWAANIYIPVQNTYNAIAYLLAGGVNITAIEMGNETYSQMKKPTANGFYFDFELYKSKVNKMELLRNFGIPISQISAPMETQTQRKWNQLLSDWINDVDFVTIHYYLNEGTTQDILTYDVDFSYYFNLFQNKFILTETNTKPSAWKGDTWENAAYLFKLTNTNAQYFESFCWHNGISPDIFGIIYNKKNIPTRNTSYYAFDMILNNSSEWFINTGDSYTIDGEAVYYYSTSLSSKEMIYGEGKMIPQYSFGYIKPCEQFTFYADLDNDEFGNPLDTISACEVPVGYTTNNTDCDDSNSLINPSALEICNLIDDDCDFLIDEGVKTTFYQDLDGDSYGSQIFTTACTKPSGFSTNNLDCNDNDNSISPGASEPCGVDKNCDNVIIACPPTVCYKRVLGLFCILDKPCKKNNCTK